jgi:hypothetical protein
MMRAILWIWQLPQNLLGFALSRFAELDGKVYRTRRKIGVALGEYVIVNTLARQVTIAHEMGHVRQSRILGPLYLPLVGVPSITMNILTRAGVLAPETYYDRYPENWADRLGGVTRLNNGLEVLEL